MIICAIFVKDSVFLQFLSMIPGSNLRQLSRYTRTSLVIHVYYIVLMSFTGVIQTL